jgi:hypothetical protein
MYTIELTKGLGWSAAVVETHAVKASIHIVDVERMAGALLTEAQRKPNQQKPDGYRVINRLGHRIRTSTSQ